MRYIPWTCLAGILLLFACEKETLSVEQEVSLLDELAYYQIDLRGHALATKAPFSRTACLLLSPRVETPSAEDFENGQNPIDIGLVSGPYSDISNLGAIWFFTNTHLCRFVNDACAVGSAAAGLDVAFVEVDEERRRITAEIDPLVFDNKGAVDILSDGKTFAFSAGTNESGEVLYGILRGKIQIDFSPDLETISGTISFKGRRLRDTGLADYKAEFTGQRNRSASCW